MISGNGIELVCAHAYAAEGAAVVAFADLNKCTAEKGAVDSISFATNPDY